MKKLSFVVILAIIIVTAGILIFCSITHISPEGTVKARFVYDESSIECALSQEDAKTVRQILDGKLLMPDSPSCGFTKDVSITIGTETYCIACDTCPLVFCRNKLRYISLTESENQTLRQVLEKYGFYFPCV